MGSRSLEIHVKCDILYFNLINKQLTGFDVQLQWQTCGNYTEEKGNFSPQKCLKNDRGIFEMKSSGGLSGRIFRGAEFFTVIC